MLIEIKDLSLSYADKIVLKKINLNLDQNFISIIGPNGSGKSTLLKIISQTIDSYTGSVIVENKNLKDYTQIEMSKIRAFVSPEENILNDLSVEQYISFGRSPFQKWFGNLEKKDLEIINKVIDKLTINDLRNKYINNLSSGEYQKVQLTRALVQEPKLLLLDEPTSHLDINHQISIMKTLREISKNGIMIIIVLHDINLAAFFSDKTIILKDSEILAYGNPQDILSHENLEKTFNQNWEIYKNPLRI